MNPQKNVSVEYAHIYTNNKVGDEQKLSLNILGDLKKEAESQNKTFSLVVLIDDYSFPDPTFDYSVFSEWIEGQGYKPDLILRESQLIPVCDAVLKLIEDKEVKEPVVDYIKAKKKYPCSLFIAAWYLLRLGHLSSPLFDAQFTAKRLVNILPTSFKPFEDKALELMAATPFQQSIQNIEHRYFEGRLIA